jgi:hypothetical protein
LQKSYRIHNILDDSVKITENFADQFVFALRIIVLLKNIKLPLICHPNLALFGYPFLQVAGLIQMNYIFNKVQTSSLGLRYHIVFLEDLLQEDVFFS